MSTKKNANNMDEAKAKLLQAAKEQAWATGNLAYLVRPYQKKLYEGIKSAIKNHKPLYAVNCCRKFGKTYILTLVFFELGLGWMQKYENLQYYGEDTAKLKDRVFLQIKQLMRECPWPEGDPRRPEFRGHSKQEGMSSFYFPTTESQMTFFGANDSVRGANPTKSCLDEAGFMSNLYSIVNDTIRPAHIDNRGTCIITSTPSYSKAHYWRELFEELDAKKLASKFTIWDRTDKPKEEIEDLQQSLIDKATGELKATWYREWMAEFVNDSDLTILPNWDTKMDVITEKEHAQLQRHPNYKDFFKFVGIDYGTKDYTVLCFYCYDKTRELLIKESSIWLRGDAVTVGAIASLYFNEKLRLWGMTTAQHPHLVIADSSDRLINQTLQADYRIPAQPVVKSQTKMPMASSFNELVNTHRFKIVETCKMDIGCCEGGVWESIELRGNRFARSDSLGHFDSLDCDFYVNWMARGLYAVKLPDMVVNEWTSFQHPDDVERKQQQQSNAQRRTIGDFLDNFSQF